MIFFVGQGKRQSANDPKPAVKKTSGVGMMNPLASPSSMRGSTKCPRTAGQMSVVVVLKKPWTVVKNSGNAPFTDL